MEISRNTPAQPTTPAARGPRTAPDGGTAPAAGGIAGDRNEVGPGPGADLPEVNLDGLAMLAAPGGETADEKMRELRRLIHLILLAMGGALSRDALQHAINGCTDPAIRSEVQELLDQFDQIDENHDGIVTPAEIKELLAKGTSNPLLALMAAALGL